MPTIKNLRGVNNVTVDPKGRVGIPSRYRQDLQELCGGSLIITANIGNRSILIYPKIYWLPVEEQLQKLSSTDIKGYMQRMMFSHATECEPDNNGRILLPPPLRKDMKIKKLCVLLALGNRFELWDQKIWDEYREQKMREMDERGADPALEDFHL